MSTPEQPGEQVEQLLDLVAEQRGELGELQVELARAVAERDAARVIAAAEQAAQAALLDELRAQLAWHRQAWWRRWIG